MKLSLLTATALSGGVQAHGFFQVSTHRLKRSRRASCALAPPGLPPNALVGLNSLQKLSINGAEQASLAAMRVPPTNNPVYDPTSSSIICGAAGTTSTVVASAASGDKIGVWFQHTIGGPQGANDADNPIAASHKGPVIAYLAKVDNAATSSQTGLKWFKIGQDTFDTSTKKWGVGMSLRFVYLVSSNALLEIGPSFRQSPRRSGIVNANRGPFSLGVFQIISSPTTAGPTSPYRRALHQAST